MSMRDMLIQGEAELDEESNDESFDEETGETRSKKRGDDASMDDSSEEEEDDDDEEAARAVCAFGPKRIRCQPMLMNIRSEKDSL